MKIDRLAEGWHRTAPGFCPKCGLSINTVSGMKRGTIRFDQRDKDAVRVMVCARCETAIARWDDKVLMLSEADEAALAYEVREALRETRNELRIAKATGRLKVPAEGP